ncbi:hypothetical protein [Paenibacillus sp. NPDC057934]|uniref:hypothetical protein n=1 Tax=Paenibacillus sp. NPDC057934 TaxID=3346282 RepID=UPI0036D7AE61
MKVLEVNKPIIAVMPEHAHALSIISAHESYENWIFSNLIQVFHDQKAVVDNDKLLIRFLDDGFIHKSRITKFEEVQKSTFSRWFSDVLKPLMDCIDNNTYIITLLDSFYIPKHRPYYKTIHRPHMTLIYGYCLIEQCFFIADFFEGFYSFEKASFEEVRLGFENVPPGDWSKVSLIQKGENQYNFDLHHVIKSIKEYKLSICPHEQVLRGTNNMFNNVYGLDAYRIMLELIPFYFALGEECMDIRSFHLMYEHKKLMILRLNILGSIFKIDSELIQGFKEIEQEALILRNIGLKYLLTKNKQCIENILILLTRLIKKEDELLSQLLDIKGIKILT